MIKRFCDFCGEQIGLTLDLDRTHKTGRYTLTKEDGADVDICNACLTKIVEKAEERWPAL